MTFDDGPNPPYTTQILDILQRYDVKASFFCIGEHVQSYPDLVKQELNAGHNVGNHSWSHPNLPDLSDDAIKTQITSTSDAEEQATGVRPTFFRPPYGAANSRVLSDIYQLGFTAFDWNVDPQDWALPTTDVIVSRVVTAAYNGSIILMHDGGGDRSRTVAALPTIIERLEARGFHLVTLSQLITDAQASAAASNVHPTSPNAVQHSLAGDRDVRRRDPAFRMQR